MQVKIQTSTQNKTPPQTNMETQLWLILMLVHTVLWTITNLSYYTTHVLNRDTVKTISSGHAPCTIEGGGGNSCGPPPGGIGHLNKAWLALVVPMLLQPLVTVGIMVGLRVCGGKREGGEEEEEEGEEGAGAGDPGIVEEQAVAQTEV